jgi:ribonuclease HI
MDIDHDYSPSLTKNKSNNFIIPISDEKKRMKELKYQIYIKGNCFQNNGNWAVIILNSKSEKKELNGTSMNTTLERMELYGLVQALKFIINQNNKKDQKHIKIVTYTESIYCTNVLKEWIHIWKKERFINRPNSDLLQECVELLEYCNFTIVFSIFKNTLYGEEVTNLSKINIINKNQI